MRKKAFIGTALLLTLTAGANAQTDYSTLRQGIATAKSRLAALADKGCAPNAVQEMKDEITVAESLVAGGKASQQTVNACVISLNRVLTRLTTSTAFTPMAPFAATTADHGFVHPGGLVSQADIDRARQLLADGDSLTKAAWNKLCSNGYSHSDVATYPTETIVRGGGTGQNYMNAARGAAMAYQNALRWKIAGTRDNADAAVRILMQWARGCKGLGGDTNVSLASGLYGYEFANAAELMRDYEGWTANDFATFKRWIVDVFYNPAIDFLRRRHDTWNNARYSNLGHRPGHYWSNWGLCNSLCVMSIGILCDDVHMYNQGVAFYKYDHVNRYNATGAAKMDSIRNAQKEITNEGCNEFIGDLVPITYADSRGALGRLGQMQESGRDQGHALMALGLALDICEVGLNQGDDLFAYMNDRIAAGTEFVAAMNFGGVEASSLPWKTYDYSDCRGALGNGWKMSGPSTGSMGGQRPYWDRVRGYYEGLRGVTLPYADMAARVIGADGGGGNYGTTSGGFDHLGFSTLTSHRKPIDKAQAIVPLSGDIIYKDSTYKNQTNLGGLHYTYVSGATQAIARDTASIVLMPQLPDSVADSGHWLWNTGQTTRRITVKADHSYVYRVTYTAANGARSQQAFAIAVAGDAPADSLTPSITYNGTTVQDSTVTVLSGSEVILKADAQTGWTNTRLWDDGVTAATLTLPHVVTSRTYVYQYANMAGAVSRQHFHLNVVPALQQVSVGGSTMAGGEAQVFAGDSVTLTLVLPFYAADDSLVTWQDGTHGTTLPLGAVSHSGDYTATYHGLTFTFHVGLKEDNFSYYKLLDAEKGYTRVTGKEQLADLAPHHYFAIAADEADLLAGLAAGKMNGNQAMYYQAPADPEQDYRQLWALEPMDSAYCLRNKGYDGLLLQTEYNAAFNMRTHDQANAISWARFLFERDATGWRVENGTYAGNWLGLWFPEHGYTAGEEMACNKTGGNTGHFQLFAIARNTVFRHILDQSDSTPKDLSSAIVNPNFDCGTVGGWTATGSWGNQNSDMLESWHSKGGFHLEQTVTDLPNGEYTVTVQMANGDGANDAYLFATAAGHTGKAVVKQSCVGSNYKTERQKMLDSSDYGKLQVKATVTDGTLTLGIHESGTNNWICFDHFTLLFNSQATGIRTAETNAPKSQAIYDLQGRRLSRAPRKGVYIINGKKHVSL